jgi:hypothetical protein
MTPLHYVARFRVEKDSEVIILCFENFFVLFECIDLGWFL